MKILILCIHLLVLASSAQAQAPDPRGALSALIQAFQNCGPQHVYQLLGVQAFQVVYQQTGGSGCYVQVQQLGPVTNMQVTNVAQYPAGPISTFRVTHSTGWTSYWQIGISTYTNRVEYINVSPSDPSTPLPVPPDQKVDKNDPNADKKRKEAAEGCIIYKAMCS
jgi:hypothetical protein